METCNCHGNGIRRATIGKWFVHIALTYNLDAESRKLRALESRGGPGLSAFERSEDATKGALMRVVSMDEASNLFRARWQRVRAIQIRCI